MKAVGVGNKKRRLRQIHLHRHILQPAIISPGIQRHNGRWIPRKGSAAEGINDEVAVSKVNGHVLI
jgi:hypothetical protein